LQIYLDKSVVGIHFYLDKSVVKIHFYPDKSVVEPHFYQLITAKLLNEIPPNSSIFNKNI